MRHLDAFQLHQQARVQRARYAGLLLRRGLQAIARWARDWGRALYDTALRAG